MFKYELPELGYDFSALEPFFDATTMEIHYSKHHATYVNNANAVFEKYPEFFEECPATFCKKIGLLPQDIRTSLRNNVGGHYNHKFFWKSLAVGVSMPVELQKALEESFGSVETFKEEFKKAALSRFGSGWAWLVLTNENKLAVVSTANQDNPLMGVEVSGCDGIPLLGLDVWEHAYYLKYQNKRADYIEAFWSVVNWDVVNSRFNKHTSKCLK